MAKLSESERKVAEWIWANPNISSTKLVEACMSSYNWKASTVFTLVKRMKEKGLLQHEDTKLKMLVDRKTYYYEFANEMLNTYYNGSLERFVESICKYKKISKSEAGRLIHLIREFTE